MRYLLSCLLFAFASFAFAAEEVLPAGAKVLKLEANSAKIDLDSPYSYAQLTIGASLEGGGTLDVTRLTKVTAPDFVKISLTGMVRPLQNGTGSIRVSLNDLTMEIPITVKMQTKPAVDTAGAKQTTLHTLGRATIVHCRMHQSGAQKRAN